ncbi:hypothetical protein BYT27DRAFT_7105838, partial [Phlegmacium glaucopus]
YTNLTHLSTKIDINVLHHHLGHLSHDNIKQLIVKGMVDGVPLVDGQIDLCEAYNHGKQHRHSFPSSSLISSLRTRRPQSGFTGASHNLFVTLRKNWQEVTEIGESL